MSDHRPPEVKKENDKMERKSILEVCVWKYVAFLKGDEMLFIDFKGYSYRLLLQISITQYSSASVLCRNLVDVIIL